MNVGELLATVPYRALRGMATRLQLRQDRQHQKRDWITAIATGWQRAPTRQQWLARLSSAAHSALARLLAAEQIPAALFWAEYGTVRQVTAQQQWTPPPWQVPATVSEELYYSGLLCPIPHPLARAQVVSLPADLRPFLTGEGQEAGERERSSAGSSPLLPAGWALCHDVGQLLIYLQSQPGVRLAQGRWLSRAHLAVLNERLWAPVDSMRLTSHRRTPYLRLLSFLADVSAFQRQGQLTAHGWQWLAASPAAQVAALQQGWVNATPDDRRRYALPDGAIARPWPHPLLQQLTYQAEQDACATFTATALVHALLRAGAPAASFWSANFHSLSDLDEVVARLLAEVLHPLGLVAPSATPAPGAPRWGAGVPAAPPPPATPGAQLHTAATSYHLALPALPVTGLLAAQAQISPYSVYHTPSERLPLLFHHYQITPATLAAAAAAGYGLPTLAAAFSSLGLTLTPDQAATLAGWHDQGRQLTVQHLPLLRTKTPAQLAALCQNNRLRAAFGEVLAPTVALVTGDPDAFARLLQSQGYAVATPTRVDASSSTSGAAGALWLAGRLYAALGDHLPLPLPPPLAALAELLAQLPPPEQSALQAQWLRLQEQLLTLLDNLPFTPPPHPSDPAQWRAAINAAIDADHLLAITYHSAGRNLTTERLVQPYWVETHNDIPYLRAYCHNAGRVLTFRLDRIAALTVVAGPGGAPGPA